MNAIFVPSVVCIYLLSYPVIFSLSQFSTQDWDWEGEQLPEICKNSPRQFWTYLVQWLQIISQPDFEEEAHL